MISWFLCALIAGMMSCAPVQAQGCGPQNPNCIVPTAPPGTSNNQAASTAFVENATAGIPIGVVCTGTSADTATLLTELATGRSVSISDEGGQPCVANAPIIPAASSQLLSGLGLTSDLKLVLNSGAPAIPAFWVKNATTYAGVSDLTINGNNNSYIMPTLPGGGGNIIYGSCVILESNFSYARNLHVENCWNNGISAAYVNSSNVTQPFQPVGALITGITCSNNGSVAAGGGACADLGSASRSIISNSIDNGSNPGFILDIGAGADGVLSTLISANATGVGFYFGGNDSVFSAIAAYNSASNGIWLDTTTAFALNGCFVDFVGDHGILMKSGHAGSIIGCTIKDTMAGFNAVQLDATNGSITDISLIGTIVASNGSKLNTYGLNFNLGSNSASGEIIGGCWYGATKAFNNVPLTFGSLTSDCAGHWAVNAASSIGGTNGGDDFVVFGLGTYTSDPFTGNHQLTVATGTTAATDYAASFGCDRTNARCYIAAAQVLTAKAPFYLNPNGGNVFLGNGTSTVSVPGTFSLTSPLTAANGGTGRATLTANAFLTGNGTGTINMVALTGLVLGNGASAPTAYAGATCTNQFITVLSAAGAATCTSVSNAFLTAGTYGNITGLGPLTSQLVINTVTGTMLQLTSANTGANNVLLVENSGTGSTSNTSASIFANLTTITNGTLEFQVLGGATPLGRVFTLAGITGGMSLITLAGPLTLTPATNVQITNIATSAGAGGLFVCIDTAGVIYKKATCP